MMQDGSESEDTYIVFSGSDGTYFGLDDDTQLVIVPTGMSSDEVEEMMETGEHSLPYRSIKGMLEDCMARDGEHETD